MWDGGIRQYTRTRLWTSVVDSLLHDQQTIIKGASAVGKQCFSLQGARSRVKSKISEYQQVCKYGNGESSWLVLLKNGNLQCVACEKYGENSSVPLSTSRGMTITNWCRLQTFKNHAATQRHKLAMADFYRTSPQRGYPISSTPN